MQPDVFLQRVLPSTGAYYIIKGDNANRFTHTELKTTKDLAVQAEKFAKFRNNIFFSTGSFKPGTSRTGEDVQYKKSFYLDLDCGKDKSFSTKPDAVAAFKKFKKESGIISPNIIVDSGNGIHLYWVLEHSIPVDQWVKVATLLKKICAKLEFAADPAITSDPVRILRLPGTTNNKSANNPKPCRVIYSKDDDYTAAEFINSIKHWAEKSPISGALPSALANIPIEDDLSSDLPVNTGPKYFKYGKDECLILHDMVETGGAAYNETAWMQAIGLLTFCEDGHDYVHAISNKHTTYSEAETEMKWRVRLRGKEAEKFGPVLCTTLNNICSGDMCSACPHNGRVKSPITLCRAPFSNLAMPNGYYQNDHGIWYIPQDPDAAHSYVYKHPITKVDIYRITNAINEISTQIAFDIDMNGKTVSAQLEIGTLADYRKAYKELANQQIFIGINGAKQNLVKLMDSWAQLLSSTKAMVETKSSFGWVKSGKKEGFSVGDTTYWEDGSITPTLSTDLVMTNMYAEAGRLELWKDAVAYVVSQKRDAVNCAIASAFAAPLVAFTDVSGVLMSLMSRESGTGKSMALSLAAAAWGNPRASIASMNDTTNSINQKLGVLKNIPAYWDEIRNLTEFNAFSKTLFQLSEGKEKGRLTATASRRGEANWQTMVVAASNESLTAHVDDSVGDSNAGRMRMIEFVLEQFDTRNYAGIELSNAVRNNYGCAGRVYAAYLAKHKDTIRADVERVAKTLHKALGARNEERFWLALITTILVGSALSNKLGLTTFDVKSMKDFLISEFRKQRIATDNYFKVGANLAGDELADYINENADHGITYTDMDAHGNPIGPALATEINPPKAPIRFEFGMGSNRYKVVLSEFKSWLRIKNKRASDVIGKMQHESKSFVQARSTVGEAASGTRGKRVPVIVVQQN